MLILLTAVNEGIGAGFVGAFEDDNKIRLTNRNFTLGYPKETEPTGRFDRIPIGDSIQY